MNDARFSGQTVLMTGAGGALGRAAAQELSRLGADLVLADRSQDALDGTLALCPGARAMALDVTDPAALDELARFARDAFGRPVAKLVAAAGILGPKKPLIEVDEAEYDAIFDVNVKALWRICARIIPQMRERGGGSVVLFSSSAGLQASTLSVYSVTKAAVAMMTRNLAQNHAAENIRVNCVCPGTIDSPMTDQSVSYAEGDEARALRRRDIIAAHPMGRMGLPSEVAAAVVFLLDDAAGFTTGTALPVDGGRLA